MQINFWTKWIIYVKVHFSFKTLSSLIFVSGFSPEISNLCIQERGYEKRFIKSKNRKDDPKKDFQLIRFSVTWFISCFDNGNISLIHNCYALIKILLMQQGKNYCLSCAVLLEEMFPPQDNCLYCFEKSITLCVIFSDTEKRF